MQIPPKKSLKISIQSCQNCYSHPYPDPSHPSHPSQFHNQSEFTIKISEIQSQLRRSLPDAHIQIFKNFHVKPRFNAFQVKFRKVLVFSRLAAKGFCCVGDLVTIVLALEKRNRYEIERLIVQLGSQDLYTYLRNKTQTIKMPYKFIMTQLDQLLNPTPQKPRTPTSTTPKQPKTRPQTTRLPNPKKSLPKPPQIPPEDPNAKTVRQIGKQNIEESRCESRNSRYRKRKTSRYSILESRIGLKNTVKICVGRNEGNGKYLYLGRDMDGECQEWKYGGSGQQEDFQILELSQDQNEQQLPVMNDERLIQIKKQQGLNFKLTANYSQRKYSSRKYSKTQYQKFAQLLQQQLKQDELKQKQSVFQELAQNQAHNIKRNSNQSSGSEENQMPSVFEIDQKELVSRKDFWMEDVEVVEDGGAQKQGELCGQNNEEKREAAGEELIEGVQLSDQGQAENAPSIELEANPLLNQSNGELQQPDQQQIIKNYQQDYVSSTFTGIITQIQCQQMQLNPSYISSLSDLSHLILYLHKQSPNNFQSLLHISNLSHIKLSTVPSINKIKLFNQAIGMFETYKLRIRLSEVYEGEVPDWVVVLCQGVLQVLLKTGKTGLYQVIRILTGAPIVKLNAVDLRRVKRIIVDNVFVNQKERKGKVLCTKQIDPTSELEFCQVVQFEKDKDFLQSKVTYRKFLSLCNQTYETTTKSYEEFVLNYQSFQLCLFKSDYYHNQRVCQFQGQSESRVEEDKWCWRILIELNKNTQVFLQFNQHQKSQKHNHILISKSTTQDTLIQSQPIGQLNKKGNFFFELSLEAGTYDIQISREFSVAEVNSIHFYSSNPVGITGSQIVWK